MVMKRALDVLLEEVEGILHQSALRFEDIEEGMRVEVDGGAGTGSPCRFAIIMPPRS